MEEGEDVSDVGISLKVAEIMKEDLLNAKSAGMKDGVFLFQISNICNFLPFDYPFQNISKKQYVICYELSQTNFIYFIKITMLIRVSQFPAFVLSSPLRSKFYAFHYVK